MRVQYAEPAKEQLRKLSKALQERIVRKIIFYAAQPDPLSFAKPLAGHDAYRFRIGHHRVIFDFENETITVLLIVGREKAYKKF